MWHCGTTGSFLCSPHLPLMPSLCSAPVHYGQKEVNQLMMQRHWRRAQARGKIYILLLKYSRADCLYLGCEMKCSIINSVCNEIGLFEFVGPARCLWFSGKGFWYCTKQNTCTTSEQHRFQTHRCSSSNDPEKHTNISQELCYLHLFVVFLILKAVLWTEDVS